MQVRLFREYKIIRNGTSKLAYSWWLRAYLDGVPLVQIAKIISKG